MNGAVLRVGFVPLLDAAPLIIAERMGFAGEEGLAFDLIPAPSWATLRDMLADGVVDAAHVLSPLPIALVLGLGGRAVEFEVLSVLSVNGEVIGVSPKLAAKMGPGSDAFSVGHALLNAAGHELRFGVPFPFSMHAELVRYWLDGLDRALPGGFSVETVPPSQMGTAIEAGAIDAFMVGEPWGSLAVAAGQGALVLPGAAIWGFAPEKVLAVRRGWAEGDARAGPMLRAVWRAGRWLGQADNRMTAAEMIAQSGAMDVSAELIEPILSGQMNAREGLRAVPNLIEFHAGAATFPWRSQAAWIAARLAQRHGLDETAAVAAGKRVFRSDLYRAFLANTGADMPGASERLEKG
ncbi:MAG: CmpA/NrtA family ABC transporter substrate-binding protein, partial [Deltaproteobacteria bacterium]